MYEIFTYGNGVMLGSLLQAISALTATPDYLQLIRLIFIISTLVAMIEIVWTGRFRPTARLLTIIVLMNAAILTTADVTITDRVNSANDSLVADVPAGLAAPLAVATGIGDWATSAFETIFSLPNDLRYRTNGLLFSSRLVEATNSFEITDTRLANNLSEFSEGCIYYGMMAGWFTLDTVLASGNIWAALPAGSFGNAIFVNYTDSGGTTTMWGCRDARGLIETDWAEAIDKMNSIYGQRLFPEYAEADAKARLLSSLPQSYSYMAGIASSAADIVRQNAMINSMRRSFTKMANNAGAPGAAQDYALAQAEAQQKTTYATLGAMAGRMMALFSNVLETIIYGIFPIAFAFILIALMQVKAILTYLKLLFWIQLWPPMFAILNFAMSVYAADATTASAMQAGGGTPVLSMLTSGGIQAVNSDMSAMAGYLSWMIPMFSWAIVSGSGYAAAQMAGSLGSVAQSSGSTAAGAVASGNISLGNYSAYNGRMFQTNNSPSMSSGLGTRVDSNTGTTFTTSAGGIQTMSTPQNRTPITANLANSIRSTTGTSLNNAVSAARTSTAGFMSSTGAAFNAMKRLSESSGSGSNSSTGWDKKQSSSFAQDYGTMMKSAEQFAKANDLKTDEAVAILASAGLTTSAGFSALGNGITIGGKGQLDYNGRTVSGETWRAAQDYAKTSGFSEKYAAATASAETLAASNTQSSNKALSNDVSSSLSNQKTSTEGLQSSLSNTSSWQKLSNRLNDQGASGSAAAVGALIQFAQSQAGGGYSLGQLDAKMAAMSSTGGDAAGATQEMNNLVAAFVQNQASDMAGVKAAPSVHDSGVRQFNAGNREEVAKASGSVSTQASANNETVSNAAGDAGVPTAASVNASVDSTRATVTANQQKTDQAINAGEAQVNTQSAPMVNSVRFNTDPENQNLMQQTLDNSGDKAVDMVGDAKDAAVDMFTGPIKK